MCNKSAPSSSVCPSGYYPTFSYTYNSCQFALSKLRSQGRNCGSGCISYSGGYYICASNSTSSGGCPANCSSCIPPSVCMKCNSGYYLSSGSCVTCPSNATCNGSSTFTCNSGHTKIGSSCMRIKPKNTVSSCPSRMTLSSDGCCCINK